MSRLDPELHDVRRQVGRVGPAARHPRGVPARILHDLHGPVHLRHAAQHDPRIDRQTDRLVERRGGELEIQQSVGVPPVPVDVPVARVEQVEPAELEPGAAIVWGRRQIVAQQVDRHLALAFPLERRGAWGDIRIDGALGGHRGARGEEEQEGESSADARPTDGSRHGVREGAGECMYVNNAEALRTSLGQASQGKVSVLLGRIAVTLGRGVSGALRSASDGCHAGR